MANVDDFRVLEIGGGKVVGERPFSENPIHFEIPSQGDGYTDAQFDDYGLVQNGRKHYPWHPNVQLTLNARFSHTADQLKGTAGFGFWNAPFGDPTVKWPALPQAVWFFFGSPPNNLPLNLKGAGQGWFASTLDATTAKAKWMIPLAPLVLLLNQNGRLRDKIWPWVHRRLGMSFAPIDVDLTAWNQYRLQWLESGCTFWVNGRLILETAHTAKGPLGFVCWLDNQYMIVTNRGRLGWGMLTLEEAQWMEILDLEIATNF